MNNLNEFNDEVKSTVHKLLTDLNKPPFLFVGSGFSKRYMGTESWEGLLKWVCESVGEPMKKFFAYKQQAMTKVGHEANALFPCIASMMEDDFAKALGTTKMNHWESSHMDQLESDTPAIKIYIADHLKEFSPNNNETELQCLQKAAKHVAGVITTNYDQLVENIFPEYQVYERQEDLLFSHLTGIGEIYKIHGSINAPDTMILDENDYAYIKGQQKYLLSKILTIFGEYPIIFLGYSLQDQDIRNIISSIAACAGEQRAKEMAKRFIFVDYSSDNCVQRMSYSVGDGQVVEMTSIHTQDFLPIYEGIASTRVRYAPKVLRQITQQLYEAVYSDGDAEKVIFKELEKLDELPQDAPVVIGIGSKGFGKPISHDDLYADMLFHNKNLSANLVVEEYLERFIPQGGAPIYYYLSHSDGPIGEKTRKEISKRVSFDAYLNPTEKKRREKWRLEKRLPEWNLSSLEQKFSAETYKYIYLLKQGEVDIVQLNEIIKKTCRTMLENNGKLDSSIRKDIKIYDFLKYGISYLNKK